MAEFARASIDDVRRAAEGWDEDQLECRMNRHTWSPSQARHDRTVNLIKVVQICHRCDSQRHQEIHGSTGALFSQWYVYGEGYLTKGIGRISGDGRDTLRLETVMRTFKITKGKVEVHSKATREALAEMKTEPAIPVAKKVASPFRKAS